MNCSSCGHENPDGAKFCMECAAPLRRQCVHCGSALASGAKFCVECGRELRGLGVTGFGVQDISTSQSSSTPLTPNRLTPNPLSYTPKHLAEKILSSRSALEGERKQVTVLFADVKGSMELAEQVDPEDWHRILDRFFLILTDGVHRYEGTVNQYTGDGIMALFGAPIAHEDHAQRACYAALYLSDELRRYGNELRLHRGLNFSVRMGLNSGEVVVGKIGNDLRMDYTAQGYTVGLAARMEQIAEPGKVYLTRNTAALVEGYLRVTDLGLLDVKGQREPVPVYELQGAGQLRTRLDISRIRGFSRFVGRANETQALETALAQTLEGHGQVVGVVGEAGVGKSRLCLEFVERCRARGTPVYEAHCPAHGKAVPFLPILQLFRTYFGVTEQDTDDAARKKIAGALVLLDDKLQQALPLVFDFLGVRDRSIPISYADPEARQRQLYAFVRHHIHLRSLQEPAVILVDDLHWIDGGSDGILAQMVEAVSGTRTMLLVNFRPEYRAPWMQKSYYEQLPLLPLGPEAIEELLTDLLGNDPSLGEVPTRIRERTGGNPFFMEEVVQSLAESGSLKGIRGAYRLTSPIAELQIPETVQLVLAARIDRLAEAEKTLLQTAAVIGKHFAESILRRVVQAEGEPAYSEAQLAKTLKNLESGELLYAESLYPEAEYTFKHPLTQEVTYRSQLAERRRHVHGLVARAIGEVHADKLDELAGLLAYHCEGAGDVRAAARWYRRAAEWVIMSDLAEAHRHWHKVRALVSTLPTAPETLELAIAAHVQLVNLGWRMGTPSKETAALFDQGNALARQAGDTRSLALLHSNYSIAGGHEHAERALELYREAVRLADQTDDLGLRVAVRSVLAPFLVTGRLQEALALAAETAALAGSDPELGADVLHFSPCIWLQVLRAFVLHLVGRVSEGAAEFERAHRTAREHGGSLERFLVHCFRSAAVNLTGESASALEEARRSVELAEEIAGRQSWLIAYTELGHSYLKAGDWDAAVEALERVRRINAELKLLPFGSPEAALATAYLGRGKGELAKVIARDAVQQYRRQGVRLAEAEAQLALANVLAHTDGMGAEAEISGAITRAASVVEETGAEILRPYVHLARATLAGLRDDACAGERELREAHRLFTEMAVTGRGEKAPG